jgi:hypothetical protein
MDELWPRLVFGWTSLDELWTRLVVGWTSADVTVQGVG